jgi:hypothetical protein
MDWKYAGDLPSANGVSVDVISSYASGDGRLVE